MADAHKLLILGAGPVGLAMAKALAEAAIPYVQVEATDHVGGNWAHGVYETAHIISSRKTTEYPDWPMPASYPDFPSAAQMCAYYNAFADHHHLRERIRFSSPVTAVRPRPDGRWDVQIADGPVEVFKGVLVCNGHHWARRLPAWTKDFRGELLHSKDYVRPAQLVGKRVLVIGGGNSGCDIVCEAARVASSADWSLRRGYWFLPKTFFGTPTVELVRAWMPIAAQRALLKSLIRVTIGRYEDYGLPHPDHDLYEAHPTVSSEVFHYLKHGRVQPRPDVVSAAGDEVTFADGARRRYDLVVAATGFDVAFPFLPDGLVPVDDKNVRLIAGMLTTEHRHLYIVGTSQPRYGLGPLVRPAAQLIARWIRLQDEIKPPLGAVLAQMGVPVPDTHLVDPLEALSRLKTASRAIPWIRWRARWMATA